MQTLLTSLPRSLTKALSLCAMGLALAACADRHPLMEQTADTATGVKTVSLTGSEKVLWIFSPYRIDVQQGNFVSQEMVTQLREGMTQDQVRFVLGTPLLTDIFHAERWDYPFRLVKRNGEVTTSKVSVYFKDNRMVRFEGGDLPTEQEYLDRLAGSAPPPKSVAPAPAPEPAKAPSSATTPQ